MVELAIDASTRSASVCLIDGDRIVSQTLDDAKTHSEALMALIDAVIMEGGAKLADIAAVYIANGPGSFTGIRIAMSVAKGLGHALNVPLYAVSTLDSLSHYGAGFDALICPIIDARRTLVYTACYEKFGGRRLIEPCAMDFEELMLKLSLYRKKFDKILFVGDAVEKYESKILAISGFELVKFDKKYLLANSEGVYFAAKAYSYEPLSYGQAMPVYLRKSQAEREKSDEH